MNKAIILFATLMATLVSGCGDSLTGLAESVLYPFESVNKDYPVPENPPDDLGQVYFDLESTDGTMMKTHAWFYKNPNSKNRVIVYFHGNGENLLSLYQYNMLGVFKSLGFSFISIDYPGLGRSTGKPNQENLVAGGMAALSWARNTFPQAPIIVWGRSLGAAVATQVAARGRQHIQGLILTSGWNKFIDVAKDMTGLANGLPEDWIKAHAYDSATAVKDLRLTTIIHHGDKDGTIPLKFGQKLFAAFPENAPAVLKVLPGREHNDMFQDQALWTDVKNFLK